MSKRNKFQKAKHSNLEGEFNLKFDEDKISKIKSIVNQCSYYDKIKFKSEIYALGDILMIQDVNEGFLIGKLVKIVPSGGSKAYPHWPTIQVQWYYKKRDLNREKNDLSGDIIFNSISDYELFESTHTDTIFIETVVAKCKVYSYEEYEELEEHTSSTFFSRAGYDPVNECLIPPFEKWEKSCLCETPLNPDQLYIKCDKCDKWYHPECCGFSEAEVENISEFFCIKCKS